MTVSGAVTAATEGKSGPLVEIAVALAARLDDPDEKSPAPVAKELRATLDALGIKSEQEVPVDDPLTVARNARAARKGGKARASGQ